MHILALLLSILGGLLVLALLILILFLVRYRATKPNEVLIVYGRDKTKRAAAPVGYRIIKQGGTFVIPVIERVISLSLSVIELPVNVDDAYSKVGVAISFKGTAQVKIMATDEGVAHAAELISGKSLEEVRHIALNILEGRIRAVIGESDPEDLYLHIDAFSKRVMKSADEDFAKIGFYIVAFTLDRVWDNTGYFESMGKARIAEARKNAVEGEAKAQAKRLELEKTLAEATRDYEVTVAEYTRAINESKARVEASFDVEKYKQEQLIVTEKMRALVIQKEAEVAIEQLEKKRAVEELEASVKYSADAEKYRVEKLALAKSAELEAVAKGESARIKDISKAEAEAIIAKGNAEAEAMSKKAVAFKQYNEAAVIDSILDKLPEIVRELSAPLAKTEKIVFNGNAEAPGVSQLTGDIAKAIVQVPEVIEALSGIDLKAYIQKTAKTQPS